MGFKTAEHWKKLPEKRVKCNLCPHECFIGNGEVGKCGVRQNMGGILKTINFNKPHAVFIDILSGRSLVSCVKMVILNSSLKHCARANTYGSASSTSTFVVSTTLLTCGCSRILLSISN